MDSLFSLRASVGLMVRAASPEACGMVDMRRDEVELGVPFFPGWTLGDFGDFGG